MVNKHLIWTTSLMLIVGMICITLIYLNHNPYPIRFEMDNNTKEAIQSINYSTFSYNSKTCYSEKCFLDLSKNQIGTCTMSKVDCKEFEIKYNTELNSTKLTYGKIQ